MTGFIPPMPERQQKKLPILKMWLKARKCLLSIMPKKSYSMKLGHYRLPFGDVYPVCQLELVKRVLVEQSERFPKSRMIRNVLAQLLGDSALFTGGDQWKMQRRMMDPALTQARLQTVFPLMLAAADEMTERFDQLPDGSLIRLDAEAAHVTADTIFRTIFSVSLDSAIARRLFDGIMGYQKAVANTWVLGVAGLPAFPTPSTIRARRAGRAMRANLEELVRPRLEDWQRTGKSDHQDILSTLIAARDPETGHVFDLRELVDQVVLIFLAGHETTAIALAWSSYLAAACPHVQDRLHAEAVEVLGDSPPEFRHLKKLKFTRDVFREALRLYPSIPFVPRECAHTEEMRGKTIKPGSIIVVSPWLIHRHTDYWERPDEFDPDRYATPEGRESLRCAWIPFSQGPRVCPGVGFAMQESALILASLARRYRFETDPDHVPRPIGRLTLRTEDGIRLRIFRR